MNTIRLPTLLMTVVVLVVASSLSGCSALSDEESPTATTPEVTPLPVSEERAPTDGVGINETGVTDPGRLVATHLAALNRSYVRNETWVMVADERLLRYEMRRVVDRSGVAEIRFANGPATGVLLTDRRDATSLEEHRHNTRLQSGVDRVVDGDETSMSWWEASDTMVPPVTTDDGQLLETALSFEGIRPAVDQSGANGTLLLTGRQSTPADPLVAPWVRHPTNATVALSVTDAGFVCSLELRYQARYDGRLLSVSYRVHYRAGGGNRSVDDAPCR